MVKSLEAGKLIIGAIAVSIDPTGVAASTLGIDAALTLKNWFADTPNLTKLARELDKSFHQELAKPRFDKPADARTLLPQMLEASFPDGERIAACGLDAKLILDAMNTTLSQKDSEYSKPENNSAFEALILPLLQTACNDPRLVAALQPQLIRKQMADQRNLKAMMQEFIEGRGIPLDDMKALAAQFGEHEVTDASSLEQFLKQKADEYRALKSEVDQIDAGLKRLSNLKAAAQDAIARVDLDEVEELLSRVQEVELEEAAKTAELRANNALLRGKVEQAYVLLNAAVDSFAAVDPTEPAIRKLRYEDQLYQHGLRYGGDGMAYSEQMIRDAISQIDVEKSPELWSSAQIASP